MLSSNCLPHPSNKNKWKADQAVHLYTHEAIVDMLLFRGATVFLPLGLRVSVSSASNGQSPYLGSDS